jgi:hypothetical protein
VFDSFRNLQKHVSIASVLKFRNALAFINDLYPFSYQFGRADTRVNCIESAQDVYAKLTLQPGGTESQRQMLHFETLALIAASSSGAIDQVKAKDLVRVFRPDREGNLSVLDFVKSVDTVYKELRFLQASIENSTQIDKSFENLVNVVFYAIVTSVILSQLGFDPFSLFLSLSSVVLAFAFAIGSASAKYFEGLLFILVRCRDRSKNSCKLFGVSQTFVFPMDLDTGSPSVWHWVSHMPGLFRLLR